MRFAFGLHAPGLEKFWPFCKLWLKTAVDRKACFLVGGPQRRKSIAGAVDLPEAAVEKAAGLANLAGCNE